MRLRVGKTGLFYGCSGYPSCRGTHPAYADGTPRSGTPVDERTKELRRQVHAEVMGQGGNVYGRQHVYAWLRARMNVSRALSLRFWTDQECERALALLAERKGRATS